MENSSETGPDWSSDDQLWKHSLRWRLAENTFLKTCRDMYAFVTSAARKGRKEVLERQMSLEERKQFDPANKKEIKRYVVNKC